MDNFYTKLISCYDGCDGCIGYGCHFCRKHIIDVVNKNFINFKEQCIKYLDEKTENNYEDSNNKDLALRMLLLYGEDPEVILQYVKKLQNIPHTIDGITHFYDNNTVKKFKSEYQNKKDNQLNTIFKL